MTRLLSAIWRSLCSVYAGTARTLREVRERLDLHLAERGWTFAELVYRALVYVLTRHEILSRASAIAFCAMLAFIPFITLVLTVGAHLLPSLASHAGPLSSPDIRFGLTSHQVATFLQALFPAGAANLVIDQIASIQAQPPLAVISITLFLALWTSSSLYGEIINALNHILDLTETRPFHWLKLRSMAMVLAETAVLFVAFLAVVTWSPLLAYLGLDGVIEKVASVLHGLLVFGTIYLSFSIIFQYGPDDPRKQHWVSPGAFFGTVCFLITAYGFRIYLDHFSRYSTAYGSLGGVMMLMFWLWLMSLVLLIAAEINKLAGITSSKN